MLSTLSGGQAALYIFGTVQTFLRHKSLQTTNRYLPPASREEIRAAM